jgi:Ca-activated chloride channel family protein
MRNRLNKVTETAGRYTITWLMATLLLLSGLVFLTSPYSSDVFIASAQKSRPKQQTSSQRTKPTSESTPSAKPSALDLIGEPPPPPPKASPSPSPEQEITPGDVISVSTTEVMLPVTVRDANGQFAGHLTRKDFRVFEDGREQPLSDLALRQVPVDVILMVDASSSVANNLDDFRRAAEGFALKLGAEDRISMIKFDDRVELIQDWTRSRFQLRRALNRIEPGMFTRFNDALLLAAQQQFANTNSRRAVIILSDGIDSGRGTTTYQGALRALLESQVIAYVVSNTEISRAAKLAELDSILGGSDSAVRFNQLRVDDLREGLRVLDQSESKLAQLTTATGGRLFKPRSFLSLDSTYAEVAEELRQQYALYYTPLNRARDGSFRQVRIETVNPTYKPQTRIGYFAPKS